MAGSEVDTGRRPSMSDQSARDIEEKAARLQMRMETEHLRSVMERSDLENRERNFWAKDSTPLPDIKPRSSGLPPARNPMQDDSPAQTEAQNGHAAPDSGAGPAAVMADDPAADSTVSGPGLPLISSDGQDAAPGASDDLEQALRQIEMEEVEQAVRDIEEAERREQEELEEAIRLVEQSEQLEKQIQDQVKQLVDMGFEESVVRQYCDGSTPLPIIVDTLEHMSKPATPASRPVTAQMTASPFNPADSASQGDMAASEPEADTTVTQEAAGEEHQAPTAPTSSATPEPVETTPSSGQKAAAKSSSPKGPPPKSRVCAVM